MKVYNLNNCVMHCDTCDVTIEHCENMMEAEQRAKCHMKEVPTHSAIWFLRQQESQIQDVADVDTIRNPTAQQLKDTILDDP